MTCASCGAELPEDAVFCLKCGARQGTAVSSAPALVAATAAEAGSAPAAAESASMPAASNGTISPGDGRMAELVLGDAPASPHNGGADAVASNPHAELLRGRSDPGMTSARPSISPRPAPGSRPAWMPTEPLFSPLRDDSVAPAETRSMMQTLAVLGALGMGLLFALALPAAHFSADMGLFGSYSPTISFSGLVDGLSHYGGGTWSVYFAGLGFLLAAGAAFGLPGETKTPAWLVTIGALMGLLVPWRALALISKVTSEASDQGVAASGSLASGLVLAALACGTAAAIPWIARAMAGSSHGRTAPAPMYSAPTWSGARSVPEQRPVRSTPPVSSSSAFASQWPAGTECRVELRTGAATPEYVAVVSGPNGRQEVASIKCPVRSPARVAEAAQRSALQSLIIHLTNVGWERIPGGGPDDLPRFRRRGAGG